MEIFTKRSIAQKIIIMLVVVILFNFVAPKICFADDGGAEFVGILFDPIQKLLLALADGCVGLVQGLIFKVPTTDADGNATTKSMDTSLLKLTHKDKGLGEVLGIIAASIAGVVAIVVGIAGAPFSGGLSLSAVAAGISILGSTVATIVVTKVVVTYLVEASLPNTFYLPIYAISPQEIFANKISILDVNFFNPNNYDDIESPVGGNIIQQQSSAKSLQGYISGAYFVIRNVAIIGLLSILVYIGIRIIVSSSAQDKAKYKQRFLDWIVAMCLIFFLHYIMNFAVTIVDLITNALNSQTKSLTVVVGANNNGRFSEYKYEDSNESIFGDGTIASSLRESQVITPSADGTEIFIWPTNLMGKARIELQLEPEDMSAENKLLRKFGYTVIFLVLVVYTVMFLFIYLKRLLMLAFLTMIAPLVAMTYPLDKLHDGSAQALNMWFKEYIFNLLIQPFHLLLYTILVGSAMEMVTDNLLYGLAAIGFMLPAEKLLRKFFGFDKASTVAGGSALGGALAMQGINQLRKLGSHGGKRNGDKQKGEKNGNETDSNRPRLSNSQTSYNQLIDNARDGSNQQLSQQQNRRQSQRQIEQSNQQEGQTQNGAQTDENGETPSQRMLDAYNEQYGSSDWNPQEAEAMSRDAYGNDDGGMNYSSDEYENILRDSGYDEDQIAEMLQSDPRFSSSDERMLDAYNEQYGSEDWDPQEAEAMSRVAYGNDDDGMNYSADEYANILRDSGYDENQIAEMMQKDPRYANSYKAPEISNSIPNTQNTQSTTRRVAQTNNSSNTRTSKPISRWNKGKAAAITGFKTAGKGLGQGIKYVAPKATKLALRGLLGATAGVAGIAAGLASDDYSNVLKYGAAGIGAGWTGGGAIANQINQVPGKLKNLKTARNKRSRKIRKQYKK